jgi:prepilin-type N-terminal cleavage/methylation domain-containing protein
MSVRTKSYKSRFCFVFDKSDFLQLHPNIEKINTSSRSGFTLLELLVVLLIISVSMSLVLGFNFKQRDSVKLKSSGRELAHFLRAARSIALVQGQKNICYYNATTHDFEDILHNKKMHLPPRISLMLSSENATSTHKIATFYPDGSAEAGTLGLQSGQRRLDVVIDPVLGDISFQ